MISKELKKFFILLQLQNELSKIKVKNKNYYHQKKKKNF